MLLALLLAFLAAPPQESGYRISADVDWVVLSASVKDRKGEFVPNLKKDNFTVLENGLPQQSGISPTRTFQSPWG